MGDIAWMAELSNVLDFCDKRVRRKAITDFPGAANGLQLENNGEVKKIGAAVDAGLIPFEKAIQAEIDFLIVHHGMFWSSPTPITGLNYKKIKTAMDGNLAVYGSHLPLDAHPEIGNNAIIAQKLNLEIQAWFVEYEGNAFAAIAKAPENREALAQSLKRLFPQTYCGIEYGSKAPQRIAILSGSGRSAIAEMKKQGIDTLITGELRQEHFNVAQENNLNLYPCGHYATEVFGVQALAQEAAQHFGLPWEFIQTDCPL